MKFRSAILAFTLALALASPAPAQSQARSQAAPRAIAQSEMQQAAREHPQLVQQFGGEVTGPLAAYVQGVGRRVAARTGVPNADFYRITVLNSPVRNAFAVPGGYVYVTRELLALMNSEDELAFVLGHEMGHVAARHGQKRQSRATIGALGSVLAQVLTGSDLVGKVAGTIGQGVLMGYSRSQENESDSLGLRYIDAAGYDPYAAPRMLSAMGAAEGLDASIAGREQSQTPSWSRTHPLSAERVQRTQALAGQSRPAGLSHTADLAADLAAPASRDRFFAAIDGMTYGDDPRQGIVDGRQFRHPALRFKFTAPQGYTIENGTSAVVVSGSGGQAQLVTGRLTGSIDAYVDQVFRSLSNGKVGANDVQTTTINGLPAAYATASASSEGKQIDITVVAYRWDANTAYHFVTITPVGQRAGPFADMFNSMAPLTAGEASAVRSRVIDVVTVARGDTAQSLAAGMAYPDYQLRRFQVLNGLSTNAPLQPGMKVKLIVFGP